jgi:hypothetical protein
MTHKLAWSLLDPSKLDLLIKSRYVEAQLGHSLNTNCLKSKALMPIASMWFMAQLHKIILNTTSSHFGASQGTTPTDVWNITKLFQRIMWGDTKCHLKTKVICPKRFCKVVQVPPCDNIKLHQKTNPCLSWNKLHLFQVLILKPHGLVCKAN